MKGTVILYQPKVDYRPYYPCFWAPLSILSVAAPLVANNFKVILLDGNLEEHEVDKGIVKENISRCICIGISCMIGGKQIERGINFSKFVKCLKPDVPVIFGGPMATVVPRTLLNSPSVDYIIRGQGEKPMLELVRALITGKSCEGIEGLMSKNGESTRPVLIDKNVFPEYPWYLLDVEKYVRQDRYIGKRVLNYTSSQGCPHKCGYCSEVSSYGCRWKAYTAKRTFEEILRLTEEYQLDGIKFYDSNFFANPKRSIEFSELLLGINRKIKWGASAHPEGIIRLQEYIVNIKESGLSRLLIGAESGSQKALDRMKKGCTLDDILFVSEICAKYCIPTAFTFIVGIPEVDDDIEKTLGMVLKMKKIWSEFDIKIHFYAPFPETPLFEEAKKHGYCSPKNIEEWSIYDYYLIQTPWLSKREEVKVRQFSDFYCDFLYPPKWFTEILARRKFSRVIYRMLRKLAEIRCKFSYYNLPLEIYWFKITTNQENFLREIDGK